jgi:hypothetical protein
VRQMLGSSPSMTLRERFQPHATTYPDAYAARPSHLARHGAVSDGPEIPRTNRGRAMTDTDVARVYVA